MRLLMCYHTDSNRVNHYIGDRKVDAVAFRLKFRELKDRGLLIPALPQSTGFGYRVVWETKNAA